MNNKKRVIFISLIAMLIAIIGLYSTYAINVYEEEATPTNYDMAFSFSLSGTNEREITVASGKIKLLDIAITNPYSDTVKYGVAYSLISPTTLPENVIVAESSMSKNMAVRTIGANETKTISLVIVNNSTESVTVSFSVINGYKNGGDLIVESGKTLIDEVYQVNPPNAPALTENLVPVYYDEEVGIWKTASYDNENNEWYNYSEKKWANAVLLTETKRNELTKDTDGNYISGQTIGDTYETGTLAFYVWIPRYKYKVWNIDKTIGTDTYSYDAYNEGIDIIFEHNKNTTGAIKCNYRFDVITSATVSNEECDGINGEYYTHPAFTFGSDELTGLWIGKFQLSALEGTIENWGGQNMTTSTSLLLPNRLTQRNNTSSNFWQILYNINSTSNNIYGLSSNKTLIDSHMITNMEWGAIAYLTHSKYGVCEEDNCQGMEVGLNNSGQSITINTSKYFITYSGRSGNGIPGSVSYTKYGTYTYDGRTISADNEIGGYNKSNLAYGGKASTTGNVYGVYDLVAGALNLVMSNMSTSASLGIQYEFNINSSSSYYTYNGYEKYLTTYSYGTTGTDQQSSNRTRLGDAIGEVKTTGSQAWNGNSSSFHHYKSDSAIGAWGMRGSSGNLQSSIDTGIFVFNSTPGAGGTDSATLAVLAVME